MGRLLSFNVGLPRDVTWQGKTVHTGIWKAPVKGPRMVRRLNIDGDGQGDLAGHGGEHRAVLVYQHDSYRYWQNQSGRTGFAYGLHIRSDMVPGAIFPDYELSDHTAKHRKLSELQEQHPMVLVLGRGGFCPKDRRQAEVCFNSIVRWRWAIAD
jgi:hypothetical protein